MNIFEQSGYRKYLEHLCDAPGAPRGFRASLARAAGCQASYLSQALAGKVHLSEDHLLGIAAHLSFNPQETEFLLLLLRYEKAGTEKLRSYLKAQMQRTRKTAQSLKTKIGAKEARLAEKDLGAYVSSWIPGAVHLLTSDPAHQTAEAIARRLSLPLHKVTETLYFLEKIGFVAHSGKGWSYKEGNLHISKPSFWHKALEASRRELAARSIALGDPAAMHFSSVYTLDEDDLKKVHALAAKLVEDSHKIIHASGTGRLACLCIDLFEVV